MTEPAQTPETLLPIPVLVGDTAAELLNAMEFPTWLPRRTAVIAPLLLTMGILSLAILALWLFRAFMDGTLGPDGVPLQALLMMLFAALFLPAGFSQREAGRIYRKMYAAASPDAGANGETARRLLDAAKPSASFVARSYLLGFLLLLLSGFFAYMFCYDFHEDFLNGKPLTVVHIISLLVFAALGIAVWFGSVCLMRAARTVRKMESMAEGQV